MSKVLKCQSVKWRILSACFCVCFLSASSCHLYMYHVNSVLLAWLWDVYKTPDARHPPNTNRDDTIQYCKRIEIVSQIQWIWMNIHPSHVSRFILWFVFVFVSPPVLPYHVLLSKLHQGFFLSLPFFHLYMQAVGSTCMLRLSTWTQNEQNGVSFLSFCSFFNIVFDSMHACTG